MGQRHSEREGCCFVEAEQRRVARRPRSGKETGSISIPRGAACSGVGRVTAHSSAEQLSAVFAKAVTLPAFAGSVTCSRFYLVLAALPVPLVAVPLITIFLVPISLVPVFVVIIFISVVITFTTLANGDTDSLRRGWIP